MKRLILLGSLLVVLGTSDACKGCINLDESSFDKIIPRFDAVLVKFDVSYPYGDKHEVFVQLAEELKDLSDLVLAEVGVKDYGDKDNEALALKHGFTKDDLPGLKLFRQNPEKIIGYPNGTEWTLDNLRNFIKDNTEIYIGLPGCLEAYDRLAMVFSHNSDKQSVIKKTEKAVDKIKKENDKERAQIYVKYMKKIAESDSPSFVENETDRLKKLVKDGKISEKKKQDLTYRINILRSFSLPPVKDEL